MIAHRTFDTNANVYVNKNVQQHFLVSAVTRKRLDNVFGCWCLASEPLPKEALALALSLPSPSPLSISIPVPVSLSDPQAFQISQTSSSPRARPGAAIKRGSQA